MYKHENCLLAIFQFEMLTTHSESMLEKTFTTLLEAYNAAPTTIKNLWTELEQNYSETNRHYHNLEHLTDLYTRLTPLKDKITNWNSVLFALYYHDLIYNATKKNNEEQSAVLAAERMEKLAVPLDEIEHCNNIILATKSHIEHPDSDINYFTDADLSILGRDWETYNIYCQKIRKEYRIYPDFLYKRGRKKVLQHFLAMERIYKTKDFYSQYEEKAKVNLDRELKQL